LKQQQLSKHILQQLLKLDQPSTKRLQLSETENSFITQTFSGVISCY